MQKLIIDRFEGDFAVCECENGSMKDIEKSILPQDAKEGSVLIVDDNGQITCDKQTEEDRRKKLFDMQNKLFSKDK